MFGVTARSSSGRDGARGLDVAMHLLDEPLDRVEAPLAAQPGEERDPQLAVVEVALEVEEEGLDEHAAAGDEGRPHADAGRRRPPAPLPLLLEGGPAGIHAVAGIDERVVGDEVGGRVAELAPALVAVDDASPQLERRAQEAGGLLELAGHHQPADVRRGDDLAVDLDERHDPRLEAGLAAQEFGVAGRLVAEAEVLADGDAVRAAAPCALGRKRKFPPPEPRAAPSRSTSTLSTNSCGPCAAKERSNGITTSSRTPRPAIRSALTASEVSSLGAASGATTARGCGSKVSTVSAPAITSRWPRCTPSNSPTAT